MGLRDARAHRFAMLASQVSTFARGDGTISSQSSTRRTTSVRRVVEAKESRIGKQPVQVPQGVTYTLKDNHLAVKGPKGSLEMSFPDTMVFRKRMARSRSLARTTPRRRARATACTARSPTT